MTEITNEQIEQISQNTFNLEVLREAVNDLSTLVKLLVEVLSRKSKRMRIALNEEANNAKV